jgi:hypothetical protein
MKQNKSRNYRVVDAGESEVLAEYKTTHDPVYHTAWLTSPVGSFLQREEAGQWVNIAR